MLRLSTADGELIETRSVADLGCSFARSFPRIVLAHDGSMVLHGTTASGGAPCLLRVPVDGTDPLAYELRPPKGTQYWLDNRTDTAVVGDDLVLSIGAQVKDGKYIRLGHQVLRVEPSGDVHVLSKNDPKAAPSPAGAVVLEETRKAGLQVGLLDPETNAIVANKTLNKAAKKIYPHQLTAGSNGLLAWWSRWEPAYGSVVFDMNTLRKLGIARSPKSIEFVSEVVPTRLGMWLRGLNKKKSKVMFVPFKGKPLTVDPCSVAAVDDCKMLMHSGPDDAVWFVAGGWNEEAGHFADPMLLRYDGISTKPTMTATGWAVANETGS